MAEIDILNIQPSVVSRDLKNKFVCIYGPPKIGKTRLAVKFPRNLLLGFEHGWNAIAGVRAENMTKWLDFKKVVKQLESDKAKEMYDSVTLDNIALAYEMCGDYICGQEGVDKVGDIPYGAGYKMVDKEFDKMVRKITQLGYGIVIIAHESVRTESDGSTAIRHIQPDMPERLGKIINRMVDITAYLGMDSEGKRWIYPRQIRIEDGNGKQVTEIFAGNHFAYLNEPIGLSYNELTEAIATAIEAEAEDGAEIVDAPVKVAKETTVDFKKTRNAIAKIAKVFVKLDEDLEEPHYMEDYKRITDEYLGKGRLVKDAEEAQSDQLSLILDDLNDYIKKHDITI